MSRHYLKYCSHCGKKLQPDKQDSNTPQYHVVLTGQTLEDIGYLYDVPTNQIRKLSSILHPDKIYAGQKLILP